jgi:hypothetical protein
MVDLDNPDLKETEGASRASVRAIVSNGVVWRPFTGGEAMEVVIIKARVLVNIDKEDDLEEGVFVDIDGVDGGSNTFN